MSDSSNIICVFNPEHDLCLANGGRNYVPPASALEFAKKRSEIMLLLYPGATAVATEEAGKAYASTRKTTQTEPKIIPWGWNAMLKQSLLRQGVPNEAMPTDEQLALWRRLQHRSTFLPMQDDSIAATTVEEVEAMIGRHHAVVMKSPWSGAGRGLHWATGELTDNDKLWLMKTVNDQECVIVEPRRKVVHDFALEYFVEDGCLVFDGYSLFHSEGGVYRYNLLMTDEEIATKVLMTLPKREALERWLIKTIVPYYNGPLGVDCMLCDDGEIYYSEINLRHTMGMVASAYRLRHGCTGIFNPLSVE